MADTIGLDDDGFFAYEVTAGVQASFVLARTTGPEPTTEREVFMKKSLVEVEQHIQQVLDDDHASIARVVIGPFERVFHYRDGHRLRFEITPITTDWRCLDCASDMLVIDEYYMVHHELWRSVVPDVKGHLCLGCLENRLGLTDHRLAPHR